MHGRERVMDTPTTAAHYGLPRTAMTEGGKVMATTADAARSGVARQPMAGAHMLDAVDPHCAALTASEVARGGA